MKTEKNDKNGLFEEVIKVQKRISFWAMVSAIVIAITLIVLGEKEIAKGLLLGTIFSVINFVLMGRFMPMVISKSRAKGGFGGLISISVRYPLLAIPMVVAIKSKSFSFPAVVVGVFAIQIVTFLEYVLIRPRMERK